MLLSVVIVGVEVDDDQECGKSNRCRDEERSRGGQQAPKLDEWNVVSSVEEVIRDILTLTSGSIRKLSMVRVHNVYQVRKWRASGQY